MWRAPLTWLAVLTATSCAEEADPPALTIGPVDYTHEQLLGLSEERRELLATITGVGLAVADSAIPQLGAPLIAWSENEGLIDLLKDDIRVEDAGIMEGELEARYLADPDWELTVRHILFLSERFRAPEDRQEARIRANKALQQIRDGADFAQTAARFSEEPGADASQGLLEPGRRGAWVDEFWDAAVSLEPGEVSEVTETEYGFHILRLEARGPVPFLEGRSRLVRELADSLGGSAGVLTLQDQLDTLSALEEAKSRGLSLSGAVRDRISAEWVAQVEYWAEELGFRVGIAPQAVGALSLAALGNPAPNPTLIRMELELPQYHDLVRHQYEIILQPIS